MFVSNVAAVSIQTVWMVISVRLPSSPYVNSVNSVFIHLGLGLLNINLEYIAGHGEKTSKGNA